MAGQQTITAVVAADARPFKKAMTDAGNSTSGLTKGLKNLALVGAASLAALAVGVVSFGVQALKAADQARQISKGLETAVKNSNAFGSSVGNIKKVTEALDEHSRKLGELIGVDDEVISGIKRNWLSVNNIARTGTTQINRLAGVAADVAAGTGKDLEAVANAFTKAYGDPKGALSKLQKAGIILTDQEKKRYDLLIETGKETEALSYLTDTLSNKFKGAAEAAASPFARLQVSLGNFQEKVGEILLPIIDKVLPDLQTAFSDLAMDPEFQKAVEDFADTMIELMPKMKEQLPAIIDMFAELATQLANIAGVVTTVWGLFNGDEKALQDATNFGNDFWHNITFGLVAGSNQLEQRTLTQASPTTNITINASSVNTSAATGQAIATALSSYYRTGGKQVK